MFSEIVHVVHVLPSYAEEHMRRQWWALSRMGASFLDALQDLTTLKIFGRSVEERERVAAESEEFRGRTMKVLRYAFLSGFVLEFMTAMAIALVAVTLGVRLVSGNMPFEEACVVLLLAPKFYKPLRELGAHRHAGMEGSAAADRIFEILNTPAPVREGSGPPGALSSELTIEFSGVGYTYPGSDRAALSDLTLTLPARYVEEETVEFGEIHVFVGSDFIVTARHGEASELREVRRQLEDNPDLLRRGPSAVLYTIMDRVVEDYGPVADGLENDIDEIEVEVFEGTPGASQAVSRRIYELSREVIQFHQATQPLAGALGSLTQGDDIDPEVRRHLRDVHDHVLRVTERV